MLYYADPVSGVLAFGFKTDISFFDPKQRAYHHADTLKASLVSRPIIGGKLNLGYWIRTFQELDTQLAVKNAELNAKQLKTIRPFTDGYDEHCLIRVNDKSSNYGLIIARVQDKEKNDDHLVFYYVNFKPEVIGGMHGKLYNSFIKHALDDIEKECEQYVVTKPVSTMLSKAILPSPKALKLLNPKNTVAFQQIWEEEFTERTVPRRSFKPSGLLRTDCGSCGAPKRDGTLRLGARWSGADRERGDNATLSGAEEIMTHFRNFCRRQDIKLNYARGNQQLFRCFKLPTYCDPAELIEEFVTNELSNGKDRSSSTPLIIRLESDSSNGHTAILFGNKSFLEHYSRYRFCVALIDRGNNLRIMSYREYLVAYGVDCALKTTGDNKWLGNGLTFVIAAVTEYFDESTVSEQESKYRRAERENNRQRIVGLHNDLMAEMLEDVLDHVIDDLSN